MPTKKTSTTGRRTSARRAPASPPGSGQYEIRGLSDQMPFGVYIPPDQVTAEVAIRVTAILACVRFLATSIASMPSDVIRNLGAGRRESAKELACYDVLTRKPNAWQSQYEHTETTVYHCALYGNAYDRIVSDPKIGFCGALEPLHPSRMSVRRMSDNSLQYKYLRPNGEWDDYTAEQIVHYRWISDNSYFGLVPSDLCGTSVSLARKLDVAAASFWDNSGRPDTVLETAETIPEPAVAELRRQWREMYAGARKRGSTAILPKKVQVKTLESNSMEASQFQELRDSIVSEVARCFGVPSTLIGDRLMNRWSTVEQEFLTAQVFCLLSWQRRIEGAIDRSILSTYGPDVSYRLDNRGLLRADTAGRTALYQTLAQWGAMSPNEIRAMEDLPPLEDPAADLTWIQQGFAPLGIAAQQLEEAGEPADDNTAAATDQADGVVLQDTALNGAQVTALLQVLGAISSGTLDEAGAAALILSAFPTISDSDASKIVAGAKAAPPADAAATLSRAAVRAAAGLPPFLSLAPMPADDPFDLGSSAGDAQDSDAGDSATDASESSGIELDGEQLKALLYLIDRLAAGQMTKASASAAIAVAFPQITPEQIAEIVDGVSQPEIPIPPET